MRLFLAAAAATLCLVAAGPAAAASDSPAQPIGGPLLSGRGLVVQPFSDAPALPKGLTASGWVVADADTGSVLAAQAPHARFLPASTLKILTAVTLIPQLERTQLVKAQYADAVVDGSKVGIVPGMSYTVDKLMTAMLVVSGNDAANALAHAAGGMRRTVQLMNDEAHRLNAFDTTARTPSGLDAPGEATSAYDLALIARAGLQIPDFRRYVATVKSSMPAPHHKHFQIYTHNRLLTTYPGDIGIKNGYTDAARGTYVGAATRHGHTIIVAMVHAQPYFWDEARSLLTWGFKARRHVAPVGQLVPPGPIEDGTDTTATADPPEQPTSTTVVLASHHDGAFPVWQVVALAGSAAVAATVTARRQRRRSHRRLSLPRI
jgi:D-alanyl-D-alanine carboxypeptidase (penicillin-binding protein 5/6)